MSVLIRRQCVECEWEPPPVPAAGFAILVTNREEDDRRRAGQSLPTVLHPLSPFVLDEFGLSYHTAAWGGQLVGLTTRVCKDCGKVFESRHLTAGGVTIGCGGCVLVALVVFIVGVIAAFASGNPFIGSGVGVTVGVLLATGTEWSAHWIIRWRYPQRAAAVDVGTHCPECASPRTIPIVKAVGQTLPCPACGQRGQQFQAIHQAD